MSMRKRRRAFNSSHVVFSAYMDRCNPDGTFTQIAVVSFLTSR